MIRIAIIGAGVSGLTNAWFLRKKFNSSQASITIYDNAGSVGGNAETMDIILKDGSRRWADMGVNDFNKVTYTEMVKLWTELGIMDTYCKPLINEESFWKGGTSDYKYWVDNEGLVTKPPGTPADTVTIQTELGNFKTALREWFKDPLKDPEILVGQWVKGRFEPEFIDNNLYPRINGMYYAQEYSQPGVPPPSLMPLWMVAHYYILQEGFGLANGQMDEARQYFVNGSTRWLEFLQQKLVALDVKVDKETLSCSRLSVQRDQRTKELAIINNTSFLQYADIVIFATHANVTQELIKFEATSSGDQKMIDALPNFKYGTYEAWAFSHQDPAYLPGQGCDKTYNIHIYDYKTSGAGDRWPYTITYIENYHQSMNPPGPLFYTTLNPYTEREPANITRQQKDGSRAVTTFHHVKLDLNAMKAQKTINDVQLATLGGKYRSFYFAGSFTVGAGLHEECIRQAIAIANKIEKPGEAFTDHLYNFEKGAERFAPNYIMEAITHPN
ncbi:MAG TPA: NAD(P)-binding protein [Bacteroidia bacterium]|jgi:predicted NAD/FAD-binding protein